MSQSRAYSQAIGRGPKEDEINPDGTIPTQKEPDAARHNVKVQWLESTITQEFLKKLSDEITNLVGEAIALSCNYHQTQNHLQIINRLIRAAELKRLLRENSNL